MKQSKRLNASKNERRAFRTKAAALLLLGLMALTLVPGHAAADTDCKAARLLEIHYGFPPDLYNTYVVIKCRRETTQG